MVNRTRINDGKIESPEVSTDKSDILDAQIDKISGGVADQPITNLSGGGLEHDGNGNLQVDSAVFSGSISGLSNPLTADLDAAGFSINNLFGLNVESLNNTRYVTKGDSIQTAIDDVQPFNGTVILDDSTFNQSFTIKTGVTVKGKNQFTEIVVSNNALNLQSNSQLIRVEVIGTQDTTKQVNINGNACKVIHCRFAANNDNSNFIIKSEGVDNMMLFNTIGVNVNLTSNSKNNRVIGNILFGASITDLGSQNIINLN